MYSHACTLLTEYKRVFLCVRSIPGVLQLLLLEDGMKGLIMIIRYTTSPRLTVFSICTEGPKARTSTPSSPWGSSESCGHSRPLNGCLSWRYGNPICHPPSPFWEEKQKTWSSWGHRRCQSHALSWVKSIYSTSRRNRCIWFKTFKRFELFDLWGVLGGGGTGEVKGTWIESDWKLLPLPK